MSKISDTADISVVNTVNSYYRPRKLTQVNGGSNLVLNSASTILSQFMIPNSVWNYSRSYLQFDLVDGKEGANLLSNFYNDAACIDSVRIQNSKGEILLDVQNVMVYSKIVSKFNYKTDEIAQGCLSATTQANSVGQANICNKGFSSTRTTANLANTVNDSIVTDDVAGTTTVINSLTQNNGVNRIQHLISSGADSVSAFRVRIKLGDFLQGTLAGIDKSLYLNDNVMITIYWNPLSKFGFQALVDGTTPGALVGAPVISNYNLFMMEELNSQIVENYRSAVSSGSGIKMVVPYVVSSQLSTSNSAGFYNMSSNISSSMGLKLKRILTCGINQSNSLNKTACLFNVSGIKFNQLQTSWNSKPLQDQYLLTSDDTLYNYNQDKIKDTLLGSSKTNFYENCFHLDDFSSSDSVTKYKYDDMNLSGLDMNDMSNVYNVSINQLSTHGLILCQYQVYSRMLMISNSGLSWVSN
jgi:hypothetical protein